MAFPDIQAIPKQYIKPDPIRNLNAYTVTAPDGSRQTADYALHVLDANGKVTSQPLVSDMNFFFDPRIYKDPETNQLYFRTEYHSRFLKYGYDTVSGKLVMQDYSGDQITWMRSNTFPFGSDWYKHDPRLDSNPNGPNAQVNAGGVINAYEVTLGGVTYDQLSVSRLLLILTLSRAEAVEKSLIDEMNKLTESNAKLEALSEIADNAADGSVSRYDTVHYKGQSMLLHEFFVKVFPDTTVSDWSAQGIMETAKTLQDSLNNLSQETMINIQSLISARDQAYLLGSNGLKLLQNGNIMVARNI